MARLGGEGARSFKQFIPVYAFALIFENEKNWFFPKNSRTWVYLCNTTFFFSFFGHFEGLVRKNAILGGFQGEAPEGHLGGWPRPARRSHIVQKNDHFAHLYSNFDDFPFHKRRKRRKNEKKTADSRTKTSILSQNGPFLENRGCTPPTPPDFPGSGVKITLFWPSNLRTSTKCVSELH